MENITIRTKYLDIEKNINFSTNITIGEVQEKILNVFNILIFDIQYIILNFKNDSTLMILGDIPFQSNFNSVDITQIDYFDVIPRDKNNSDEYINKYIYFMKTKDDELIAKNLQTQMDTSDNLSPFFNILNSLIQQNLDENSTEDPDNNIDEETNEEFNDEDSNEGVNQSVPFNSNAPNIFPQLIPYGSFSISIQPIIQSSNNSLNVSSPEDITDENDNSIHQATNPLDMMLSHLSHQLTNNLANSINSTDPTSTSTLFNLFTQMMSQNNMEDVKTVSTKDEIKELKTTTFKLFRENPICKINQCNICLEEYEEEHIILCLKCDHYFHKDCIVEWLEKNSNKCPICRETVSKGKFINL